MTTEKELHEILNPLREVFKLHGLFSPTDSIKGFIPQKGEDNEHIIEEPEICKNCKGYKFKNLKSYRR